MKRKKKEIEAFLRDKPYADAEIRRELQKELEKLNKKKNTICK